MTEREGSGHSGAAGSEWEERRAHQRVAQAHKLLADDINVHNLGARRGWHQVTRSPHHTKHNTESRRQCAY